MSTPSVLFPDPGDTVMAVNTPSGMVTSIAFRLFSLPAHGQALRDCASAGAQGSERTLQVTPVGNPAIPAGPSGGRCREAASRFARPAPGRHVVCPGHNLGVVLDDDNRVALIPQGVQDLRSRPLSRG